MRRMRTTGYIAKQFFEADKGTIVRKPNLRRFAKENGIFYHVLPNTQWLIDVDDFLLKVNPKLIGHQEKLPRLRNIKTSVDEFNNTYPKYQIDRHTIEKLLLCDNVLKIKHGNRWIINYDELEQELLKTFKPKNKL